MPRVRLTDLTLDKLPLSKARITYWDEGFPSGAFGVRCGARRKTFLVVMNGGHRIKLGVYPFMSLKDARREAHLRLGDRDGYAVAEEAPAASEVVKKFIEIHHARALARSRSDYCRSIFSANSKTCRSI